MASHFDRWEKDPFFSAAEEVQESADRMESMYRTWIHSMKDSSGSWNPEEIRRDLHTALGTTKWQLEEFDHAVKLSYGNSSAEDAKKRHKEFIIAIESQISKIESLLQKSITSDGKPPRPWVHLDEGERNELALFLSGPSINVEPSAYPREIEAQSIQECKKNSRPPLETKEDKLTGHRRTASANADISSWKIAVCDDVFPQGENKELPPRKIPSFSGLLSMVETASKSKWSNNGYRKLKTADHHQEADSSLLQSQQLTRCYERSKSCFDGCDDNYDKQLYGWYGSIHRLLQRSQYQLQFSQPLQMVFWIVLLVCSIGLFAMRAI